MKLLLRDYLASLKEREELDAILPDLLSELGFTILSRPQRGTQQRGVDIAAVGPDEDGERKVFLFSVKAGDLTRQDWDGTPQALRSSLNEIRDVYIANRIPTRYKALKVVICIAVGGVIQEQVRDQLKGYTQEASNERISFHEWNGDKIAGLILTGVLREELLPKPLRSNFQKAVAMVDEPDISYEHFARLAQALRKAGAASGKARVRAARQLNLCLWVLFVWSRDVGNLEAAYRASELSALSVWDLLRPTIGTRSQTTRDMVRVMDEVVRLYLIIAGTFLERNILPHTAIDHGLSLAVRSREPVDVNLALFETLGRIGLIALWSSWFRDRGTGSEAQRAHDGCITYVQHGLDLIRNNPALFLPITDRQATDIALFLLAVAHSGLPREDIAAWLKEMTDRLDFSIRTRGRYPSTSSDYNDLADHPVDRSDDYFEEATAGSTLIPLIATWLYGLGQFDALKTLASLVREKLSHCTLQVWMPDADSEDGFYSGEAEGGQAVCNLEIDDDAKALIQALTAACESAEGTPDLSAMSIGFWPLVLMACRHHRLPIPPNFWIAIVQPEQMLSDVNDPITTVRSVVQSIQPT